ncbi:MAG: hypothetical protein H6727_19695 [Myxococcales bacterium]|nr:hypothetical protein [Myxococcales bacterium]
MSDLEAQINAWEQRLLSCGLSPLTMWQRDIMRQWSHDASWIAFFPLGGGIGYSYLLPALEAQTGVTLVICQDQARCLRREQQAQRLGDRVTCLKEGQELPDLHTGVMMLTAEQADTLASSFAAWKVGRVQRIILDGCPASPQAPAWWDAFSGVPFGIFPLEGDTESWWSRDLGEQKHETLHYDHEELHLTWDLGEGSLLSQVQHAVESGVQTLWVLGGRLFRTLLKDVEGVQIHDPLDDTNADATETTTHATLYLFPHDTELRHSPPPQQIILGRLPSQLRDLGTLMNQPSTRISLPTLPTHSKPASEEDKALREYLQQQATVSPHAPLYLSSHELMQAAGLPIAPQIAYERSLQQLEEMLDQLREEGSLAAWASVHFQAKVLNTRGFASLQHSEDAELKTFHEAYTQMQSKLGPMEALQLSMLNGRALDLRKLAKLMPYNVKQLDDIFQKLNEKNLVVNQLEHVPGPQHTLEHEYQIEIGEFVQISQAVQLWAQSGDARLPLLSYSLSRQAFPEDKALRALWEQDPQTTTFWEQALALLNQAQEQQRLYLLGGRLLQRIEQAPTDAGMALWLGISTLLGLAPPRDPAHYRKLLPAPRQAPIGLFPLSKKILHLSPHASRSWTDYLLALPGAESDEEMIRIFVDHAAPRVLGLQRMSGRFRWLIQRYNDSMTHLALPYQGSSQEKATETTEATDATEASGETETTEASTRPSPQLPSFHPSTLQALQSAFPEDCLRAWGWVLHLLGHSEVGLPLLRLSQDQNEANKQRYAKLVLQTPKQLFKEKSDWLRWLINESEDRNDEMLRKRVVKILVDRKEGTPEELALSAQWAEEEGDNKRAARLHKLLMEARPDTAEHPAALARISLQNNKLQDALRYAIQANRLSPRHYPMESFLEQAQEALFADLDQLRHLIVDLPAHPALSKIENELSLREDIARQLVSTLKETEEALKQKNLAQARDKAREVLKQHQHLAPVRFIQIRREVDQEERKLQKELQRLTGKGRGPKYPRERNKQIEALGDQAAILGFATLATETYRRLLQRNDVYGLAWVKLARCTPHQNERDEAYAKALSLTKGPEQRRRNLEEWAQVLDKEGRLDVILPSLLEVLEQHNEESQQLEPILLKLIGKYGVKAEVSDKLEGFLKDHKSDLKLKRAEQALSDIDHLDPWKRQLLSMQAEIAQKTNDRARKKPRNKPRPPKDAA